MLKVSNSEDDVTDIVLGASYFRGREISNVCTIGIRRYIHTSDPLNSVPMRGTESIYNYSGASSGGCMHLMVNDVEKLISYRQKGGFDRCRRRMLPQIGMIHSVGDIK